MQLSADHIVATAIFLVAAIAALVAYGRKILEQETQQRKALDEREARHLEELRAAKEHFIAQNEKRLEECERTHEKTTEKMIDLCRQVGTLEGEIKGMRETQVSTLSEIRALCNAPSGHDCPQRLELKNGKPEK